MTTTNERPRGRQVPQQNSAIDLAPKQRAIVEQIQADRKELDRLEAMRDQLIARINANRGKLELIAELAEEYGQPGALSELQAEREAPPTPGPQEEHPDA